jgi:hypothetical protein
MVEFFAKREAPFTANLGISSGYQRTIEEAAAVA